jgi:protein involved in polysaccharide export with SLBB domain
MRLIPLLLLSVVLASSASAESIFSRKKVPASPATAPAVTVTKPGAADSDSRPATPRTTPSREIPVARAVEPGGGNAVFRPGDSLDMRVSGIPAEDATAFPSPITIGADGMINITYAGQIHAAGLTQSQLEQVIQNRFISEKIFRWPTVAINVMSQQRAVTVGGSVRAPGRQPWTADLTLMSALSAAGGPSDFATDKVNVIRNGVATQYRMKQLKKNPANDPKLLPGDQVDLL